MNDFINTLSHSANWRDVLFSELGGLRAVLATDGAIYEGLKDLSGPPEPIGMLVPMHAEAAERFRTNLHGI